MVVGLLALSTFLILGVLFFLKRNGARTANILNTCFLLGVIIAFVAHINTNGLFYLPILLYLVLPLYAIIFMCNHIKAHIVQNK